MNWIFCFIVIAACAICGMLGLTAGINLNPVSTVKYVWDWNAAGSWISGIGAFLAVGVALWQSHLLQEKEKASCRILLAEGEWFFKVQIVSDGIIPSTVISASISFGAGSHVFDLSSFPGLGFAFPRKLDRGDVSTLIDVHRDAYRRLAMALASLQSAELARRDITPRITTPQGAEEYFSELKSCGEQRAYLLLKTAHADLSHPLPPSLMRSFFSLVEAEQRETWKKDRESLKKEFARYAELSSPADGESSMK